MSWYVRRLFLEGEQIRTNIYSIENSLNQLDEDTYLDIDFNQDSYLDLLTLEQKLKEFIAKNLLTEDEILVAKTLLESRNLSQVQTEIGFTFPTIKKIFNSICTKLAYALGGRFTDNGTIEYFKHKYDLSPEQVELMAIFIEKD